MNIDSDSFIQVEWDRIPITKNNLSGAIFRDRYNWLNDQKNDEWNFAWKHMVSVIFQNFKFIYHLPLTMPQT